MKFMTGTTALALVLGFIIGVAAGGLIFRYRCERARRLDSLVHERAQLIMYRSFLGEIRDGLKPDVLEAMEFSIDCSVSALWADLDKLDSFTREGVLQSLREVQRYRQKWPRRITPLTSRSHTMVVTVQEAAIEAEHILLALRDARNEAPP